MLIPFQLKQLNYPTTKDSTDLGPTKEKVLGPSDIAYITGAPQMPQLEATISAPSVPSVTVEWRMQVTSERPERNTKDDLRIPATGVVELPINSSWRIDQTFIDAASFFGGSCTLFYRLKLGSGYLDNERSFQFKIRGKNPKDADAKGYIMATQGSYRFSWAMAQHESRQGSRVYNQFNSAGRTKELPNYSADGKNGWGMFQRDDTDGGIYLDTRQVYDWQNNTQVFYDEMATKRDTQQRFFDAVAAEYPNIPAAQSPPSSYTFPGTVTSMFPLEAGEITLYNGAAGCPPSRLGGIKYKNPWKFDPITQQWSYNANSNNYLYKVVHDEVEHYSSISE